MAAGARVGKSPELLIRATGGAVRLGACDEMWIELHDSAREHPKVVKLARDLGISRVTALGHVISLWLWTLRMAPDGNLSSFDAEDVEVAADWVGEYGAFVAACLHRRLLDKTSDGLLVHDWEDFSGSLKAADRARKYREHKINKENEKILVTSSSRDNAARSRDITLTDRPTDQTDRPTRPSASSSKTRSTQALAPRGPTVIEIPLVTGDAHQVTEADVSEWSQAYPAVDVLAELRKLRQWNLARPRQRKTTRGVRAHITGWLAREQDRGGHKSPSHSPALTKIDQSIEAAFAATEAWNATR